MRKTSLIGFGLAAALASTTAHAAEFGQAGDVSIAADRLMGVYILDRGDSDTLFSIGASMGIHPYTTARLGIDGFIIDGLSLGGTLAVWFDDEGGRNRGNSTAFLIYPRIGYAISFSDSFGFWPRGGLTITTSDPGNDNVALTFEATFFGIPVEHFGLNFGPTIDVAFAGDRARPVCFGLITGGVFGWL